MFRYFFHPGVGDVFKLSLEGRDKDLSMIMIKYWATFPSMKIPIGRIMRKKKLSGQSQKIDNL